MHETHLVFLEDRLLRAILPHSWYLYLHIGDEPIHTFLSREARAFPDGIKLLDAGAGEGRYKTLLTEHAKLEYVGIDFALGEKAWDYGDLDVVGNVLRLPFAEASFDVVVCTQVLEHVPEPKLLLTEIQHVLKPGGRLLLTAPLSYGLHQEPYDFFRYTEHGLRYLAKEAGFRETDLEQHGGYFTQLTGLLFNLLAVLVLGMKSPWAKVLFLPFRIVLAFMILVLLPPIARGLDNLFPTHLFTMGYSMIATKPEGEDVDA